MTALNDYNIRLLAPLVVGYGVALLCPMNSKNGSTLNSTPPSWVFGVMWFAWYIILGWSWSRNASVSSDHKITDYVFGITTALLALWLVLYSCNNQKRNALYVLVAIVALSLATVVVSIKNKQWIPAVLLCGYVAWVMFATKLNSDIVNDEKN
jgi:tryptophan-rich sensory protein